LKKLTKFEEVETVKYKRTSLEKNEIKMTVAGRLKRTIVWVIYKTNENMSDFDIFSPTH
jgi:hypothetical protein